MNVATGGHSKGSLQSGSKIGDDVAKHIVGHDDIELARLADHLRAERVHVHMFGFDLRMFSADLFEDPLPETASVGHGVGLIAHQYTCSGIAVGFSIVDGVHERESNYALHAFARVYVF